MAPNATLSQEISLNSAFDPRLFTDKELELVEIGMVMTGNYLDVIGAWADFTTNELARLSGRQPLNVDAARMALLARNVIEEVDLSYRIMNPSGVSHSFIFTSTDRGMSERFGVMLSDDGVSVETRENMHANSAVIAAAMGNLETIHESRSLSVYYGQDVNGAEVYLHSNLLDDGSYIITEVTKEPNGDQVLFDLATRSIIPEIGSDYGAIVVDGRLLDLVEQIAGIADGGNDNSPGQAGPSLSYGTGFFIDQNYVVSAHHVVAGCSSISFADGIQLTVVGEAPDHDLVLLQSSSSSDVYFEVELGDVQLGSSVFALGYPFYPTLGTELSLTDGKISKLSGYADKPHLFTISAPIQAGNSGGPLLTARGAVVGVISSQWQSEDIREAFGRSVENVSFAVKSRILNEFLNNIGLSYTDSGRYFDLTNGISSDHQRAVRPIICKS